MSDLRALAAAIANAGGDPKIRLRQATIVSVQTDSTVTLTIAGGSTQVTGVKVAASCCPIPGATCWVATDGKDMFVMSTLAPVGPAYVFVTRAATQSIADSTFTNIQFDTQVTDNADMWVATSPAQFVAKTPGLYSLNAFSTWPNATVGSKVIQVLVNGAIQYLMKWPVYNGPHYAQCTFTYRLALNDVVTFQVFQNTGAAVAMSSAAAWCHWLGPA